MAVPLFHGLLADHRLKVTWLFHFDLTRPQILVQQLVRDVLLLLLYIINPLFVIKVEVIKPSLSGFVLFLLLL